MNFSLVTVNNNSIIQSNVAVGGTNVQSATTNPVPRQRGRPRKPKKVLKCPYVDVCPLGPDWTTHKTENWNQHVKAVHHKIRDYHCPFCEQDASKKETIDRHVASFHPDKLEQYYSAQKKQTAVIVISDGCPGTELLTCAEILRESDIDVTISGIAGKGKGTIATKNNIRIVPDAAFSSVQKGNYDAVILLGEREREGVTGHLRSQQVGDFLRRHHDNQKIIAAIGTGPLTIVHHGIAGNCALASHPSLQETIIGAGYNYSEGNVEVDKARKVVTGRGFGTASEFALTVAEMMTDEDRVAELRRELSIKETDTGSQQAAEDGDDAAAEQQKKDDDTGGASAKGRQRRAKRGRPN